MRGGHGFPIIHGDGRRFTMAAGTPIHITDPYGFLVMNGGRDGLPGEDPVIITDGHP